MLSLVSTHAEHTFAVPAQTMYTYNNQQVNTSISFDAIDVLPFWYLNMVRLGELRPAK